MNALLVDDEVNNLDNLQALLGKHCPEVSVVGRAGNVDTALELVQLHRPDLIFLDIQMPDKNGFELLKALPERDMEVIFVTAYDQYGIQAVKFSAIDYLLKPINIEEMKGAVDKVRQRLENRKRNLQLENLLGIIEQRVAKENHRIALPSQKEVRLVEVQQIVRCEATNNYTSFYLLSGEELVVSRPIYEYEELLSHYGFVRCHQSHLVNRKHVLSFLKEDGGYLRLADGYKIPVSRQKKEEVKRLLGF
ncbi:LytR/AlgR family response regulator transcription factor [Olivibacter sitiensis]|uniref:LytR/AlgR family response regulator transcription factor n=1 Tax=Olivibacter sitiensis TaxID=376470 RepID=UPI00041BB342|nr:LytTR family DNA-binding domain-containing protein [Olivibacter sitiensis]